MSIKVWIESSVYNSMVRIAIIEKDEQSGRSWMIKPVNPQLERVLLDESAEEIETTMKLSGDMANEFLKAMAEALDKRGIKTDNDFKIKGLLEAKEKHLQDMRRLVFK